MCVLTTQCLYFSSSEESKTKKETNEKSSTVSRTSERKKKNRVRFSRSLDEQSSGPITLNARRPTTGNPLKKKSSKKANDFGSEHDETKNSGQSLKADEDEKCQLEQHHQEEQFSVHETSKPEEVESSEDEILDGGNVIVKSLDISSDIADKEIGKTLDSGVDKGKKAQSRFFFFKT